MNVKEEAEKLWDLLIVEAEQLEQEDQTAAQWEARRVALDEITRLTPQALLKRFNQVAKEIDQPKPLEQMNDKEKLEVMIQMFNEMAIAA
jgi:hypothetical protein